MAKINQAVSRRVFAALFASVVVTGCSNNVATNVPPQKVAVAQKPPVNVQQKVVVLDKARRTAGMSNMNANTVKRARTAKDQHHVAHDKKRMWYNQQWLVKQEAEERQRVQRLQYQQRYEEKLQQQAQLKQQQAYQARWEQQRQKSELAVANANMRQQTAKTNQYQQRQAQIEARQQQYNWQQDGDGWKQAQARTQAQARHKFQQQQIRQQHQQRWQQQQRVSRARHSGGNLAEQLSNAAIARTYHKIHYDGRYIPISYPMGDVPAHIGVCTDTLIRSYRRLGLDLQQLVHEDISRAFHAYPNLPKWGLSAPDPNIDHRRVHNLKVFFSRHGQRLPVTNNPTDYRPGDIVTWHLGGDQEHIGLVVNRRSPEDPRRHMIVHNIAKGDRMEDILFKLPITGHYRYLPNRSRWLASR